MILADTSIWADHISAHDPVLASMLEAGDVVTHPMVIGELSLGNLARRRTALRQLRSLSQISVAAHSEVLELIETHALGGTGIGFVDAHLLASTVLSPGTLIWTRDRRLDSVSARLSVAAQPIH